MYSLVDVLPSNQYQLHEGNTVQIVLVFPAHMKQHSAPHGSCQHTQNGSGLTPN